MKTSEDTFEVRWPWTMIPLDCVDGWIECLKDIIGPGHPLYRKKIFPEMRRDDGADILLIKNDSDDNYVFLYRGKVKRYGTKRMPYAEIIDSWDEVIARLDKDHRLAMNDIDDKEKSQQMSEKNRPTK